LVLKPPADSREVAGGDLREGARWSNFAMAVLIQLLGRKGLRLTNFSKFFRSSLTEM
jgi:hypothetical protein